MPVLRFMGRVKLYRAFGSRTVSDSIQCAEFRIFRTSLRRRLQGNPPPYVGGYGGAYRGIRLLTSAATVVREGHAFCVKIFTRNLATLRFSRFSTDWVLAMAMLNSNCAKIMEVIYENSQACVYVD